MPIRPKPYICKCSQCHWEKGVAPLSDALTPLEYFDACPDCGNEELDREPLSTVKKQLWRILGKMSDQI